MTLPQKGKVTRYHIRPQSNSIRRSYPPYRVGFVGSSTINGLSFGRHRAPRRTLLVYGLEHYGRRIMRGHQFKLNLPADVKAWLEEQAQKNVRSQGAEIVFRLREQMAKQETAA